MGGILCLLTPGACAATSLGKATVGTLFDALTSWILSSVQWFLSTAGTVLGSASEPTTVIHAAGPEFSTLETLSPLLLLVGLLVTTVQSLRRGDSESLWKVYFFTAPACVLGIFCSQPVAKLLLEGVNQLSGAASSSVVANTTVLSNALMSLSTTAPGFGVFLLAIGVVVGTFLLWCELIVRTVVLTLLLVLVPIIVPLGTLHSGRRLVMRLAETFLGLAVSKFFIVVTLTLGLSEMVGDSPTEVITGIVTLALATLTPFILLRLIPFVEQSALHNVEGLRRRFTSAAKSKGLSAWSGIDDLMTPPYVPPSPPERPEDLGIDMWPASEPMEMPVYTGKPYKIPVGKPTLRGGHVHYGKDEMGPYVGWHFDE